MSRRGLLAVADTVLERQKKKREGKVAVFTTAPSWLVAPELPDTIRIILTWEREILSQYVSSHPLEHLNLKAPHSASFIHDRGADEAHVTKADTWVEMAGVITDADLKTTRRGSQMAFFGLEMLDGVVRCLAFSGQAEGVANGWVVKATGVIEDRESDRIVKVNRLQLLERW